jgi:phage-related protein (TIGR01555 family)
MFSLPAAFGDFLARVDSWSNAVTGLGQASLDKSANGVHLASRIHTDAYWDDLYNDDPIARRICEIVPNEMLREGFDLHVEDDQGDFDPKDIAGKLEERLYELGIITAIKDGLVWERAQGGAVVLLGVDDGISDPSKPLNLSTIRSFDFVTSHDKARIFARKWYPANDPKSGTPMTYLVQNITGFVGSEMASSLVQNVEVHESRLFVFPGGRVSLRRRIEQWGWGHSVLASVHDVLRDYNMSWAGLTHMVQSASQDVWKFKGFHQAMQDGQQQLRDFFFNRILMTQMKMGVNRGVVLDSDGEDFSRIPTQFNGVSDIMLDMEQRVCASVGAPITILFGRAPHGLNASGEQELQSWYDSCSVGQVDKIEPFIKRACDLIMLSPDGPTGGRVLNVSVRWHPLKQLSPLEEADLRLKQANVDKIEIDAGMISPEEGAVSRHRPDGWSSDTKIDLDARENIIAADMKAAASQSAGGPEPKDKGEPVPKDGPQGASGSGNAPVKAKGRKNP